MANYKAKTKSQIADEFGVSRKTLYNWLSDPIHRKAFEDMNISISSHLIPPKGVNYIYENFGEP